MIKSANAKIKQVPGPIANIVRFYFRPSLIGLCLGLFFILLSAAAPLPRRSYNFYNPRVNVRHEGLVRTPSWQIPHWNVSRYDPYLRLEDLRGVVLVHELVAINFIRILTEQGVWYLVLPVLSLCALAKLGDAKKSTTRWRVSFAIQTSFWFTILYVSEFIVFTILLGRFLFYLQPEHWSMIAIDRLLLVSIDESLMAGPFLGMVLQSGITVVIAALVLIWSTRAENPDFFRKELPLVAWSFGCGVIVLSCICLLLCSGCE